MNKIEKFKGLSVEKVWLPLTQSCIEANNLLHYLTNNDRDYCVGLKFIEEILKPMYNVIDDATFDRFTSVFVYVLEFVYGDPYCKSTKSFKRYVTSYDYFSEIMKNWNTDIDAELAKVDKITKANKK